MGHWLQKEYDCNVSGKSKVFDRSKLKGSVSKCYTDKRRKIAVTDSVKISADERDNTCQPDMAIWPSKPEMRVSISGKMTDNINIPAAH